MEYKSKSILECVQEINLRIYLPDIQRKFIWNEENIYMLFDSLLRDYPINTFLFWKIEKETFLLKSELKRIKFVLNSNSNNELDTSFLSQEYYYLVIDGQQRLTSLYLALKGNYKNSKDEEMDLYFNIDSGKEDNIEDMKYEFQFYSNSKIQKIGNVKRNWLRIKDIFSSLDSEGSFMKEKFCERNNIIINDDQITLINRLVDIIVNKKLITYYEETTQEYDKVLDIFIRANSGGIKLNYSDLLFSHIKLKWFEARDIFQDLLNKLNEAERFKFTNDIILKTILFIYADNSEEIKYKTQNFSFEKIQDIKNNWEDAVRRPFAQLKDVLVEKFFLSNDKLITSYNALIPIVYFISKNRSFLKESNKSNKENICLMREWLITCMLASVFGGQSDGILYKSKIVLRDIKEGELFPSDKLFNEYSKSKHSLTLTFDESRLNDVSYNSTYSFLILSLFYKNSINFTPAYKNNRPQQDHIFSKDELKKSNTKYDEKMINSIYNIRFATEEDNKSKSNKKFADWLKTVKNETRDLHGIPSGEWGVHNFEEFMEKRKELFIKRLGIIKDLKVNNDWVEEITLSDRETEQKNVEISNNYTIDKYKHLVGFNRELFMLFKEKVMNLIPKMELKYNKWYVAFVNGKRVFMDAEPKTDGFLCTIKIDYNDINDPLNKFRNVQNIGKHGNGNIQMRVKSIEDVEYIFNIIKISKEKIVLD